METSTNAFEVQRSLGRIEGGIGELKTELALLRKDHSDLRGEFNKLEAGRLTRLESAFAVSEAGTQAKAKNIAILFSSIIAIATSIATAAAIRFFNL